MRHLGQQRKWTVALLLLCVAAASTAVDNKHDNDDHINSDSDSTNNNNNNSNYNCPTDCECNVAQNTHKPLLHAKCSSLMGLLAPSPLPTTYPLHSVDLSYLRLSRLSHALEHWTDVTSLDLSHNELHDVGHLGRRIKKLNLRHNRIASNKLTKMPQHVQELNLQHNDITYLPQELMQLTQLHTLELSHNAIDCSCETLEVRNWLLSRRVFMEYPVVCSTPHYVKGKPWLQVSQTEICEREKHTWAPEEDENELMMGDQPIEGSGDMTDGEDELGKDFMPISTAAPGSGARSAELQLGDVEGSGDLSDTHQQLITDLPEGEQTEAANDENEGSGSGYSDLIIPMVQSVNEHVQAQSTTEQPSEEIFGNGMGIFHGDGDDGKKKDDQEDDKPDDDDTVVAPAPAADDIPDADSENVATAGVDAATEGVLTAAVRKQPTDDSNATYYLLGVIILIVVGLILFVGIKRCKNNADGHDVENPRQTELLDMDGKNPGKPLRYNGLEHAPLIGDKTKSDLAKPINGAGKTPYSGADVKDGGTDQQKPLLNGNDSKGQQEPVHEQIPAPTNAQNTNEPPPHEYYPITPRYPTPKSPRASKYAQYPQNNNNEANNNNNNNNNNNLNDQYLPSSPKSGRYSPVYSPETGRVKIKLTETPRPKTPMLVTRTKSNAGDIITTPVRMGTFAANNNNNNNNIKNNLEVTPVHAQQST